MAHSKFTRRQALVAGLGAAGAALLAACGGAQPAAPAANTPAASNPGATAAPAAGNPTPTVAAAQPPAAAKSPVEMTWAIPGNTDEQNVYKVIGQKYIEQNSHVKIVYDREASDLTPFLTRVAAGNTPDVAFATINNFGSLAGREIFAAIDDNIKRDNFDLDDFYPQIIKPYQFDGKNFGAGKLYGLPKEIAVRSMFYNTDMFKEAGVAAPDPAKPWTFDEFKANAEKLTKREGERISQYGYVSEDWLGPWMIWAWANGGDLVDNPLAPTKITLTDPKVVDAFTMWTDFVTKMKISPNATAVKEAGGRAAIFAGKRAATYNNGRWNVPAFRNAGVPFEVMPMPQGPGGRAQLLTGSIFGVSKSTKFPNEAWGLLKAVSSKEGQTEMTKLGLLLPSRKSVAESDIFLKSSPPSTASNGVYIDELKYARLLPMHKNYTQMQKAVDDEKDLVLNGQKTPKAALESAQAALTELLKA